MNLTGLAQGGPLVVLVVAFALSIWSVRTSVGLSHIFSILLALWFGLGTFTSLLGLPVPFPKPLFVALLIVATILSLIVSARGLRSGRVAEKMMAVSALIALLGVAVNVFSQ